MRPLPNTVATIGDNNPPTDAQIFRERMQEQHPDLLKRADDLVAALERLPSEIGDDETAGRVTDYISQLAKCRKAAETTRVAEKEPYLSMGRTVDGYFKAITDKLDNAKTRAQRPLTEHLNRKAEEERKERLRIAEEQRLAAQRAADEAAQLEASKQTEAAEETFTQAQVHEQRAVKMEVAATARPAQLANVRGAEGSGASLRTRWVGKLINRDQLDVARLLPFISDEALQKAINGYVAAGHRELRGVSIVEESTAVVR